MARQHKIFVTGAIGPVIFYEFRGKPVARAKPTRVRQSKATKSSAKDFGRAASYSKQLRDGLAPLMTAYKDRSLMYQLNSALHKWLRESMGDKKLMSKNIRALCGLQLNEEARSQQWEKPAVNYDEPGKIMVTVPAVKPATGIYAPRGTTSIRLIFMAVGCNIDNGNEDRPELSRPYKTELEIKYNNTAIPAQPLELPFAMTRGDLVLVAMGVSFWIPDGKELKQVADKRWMQGTVIGAFYKE